jgi:hypothetical protein
MKPMKQRRDGAPTPTPAAIRNQLLHRIRKAEFPKDAGQFTLAELRASGLAGKYKQPLDLADNHFKLLVLLATQNNELRQERDRLRLEMENEKDYYSPVRDESRYEPDPLKQEEINRRAEADEARVARDRATKKQSQEDAFRQFVDAFSRRPWIHRDKRRQPWQAVFWHEPMTVMAYHQATGLTRRTIQNVLRRIKAAPLESRHRRNEPARYGTETNFAVLRAWLIQYEKKPENRRAWLVRTLLKCAHEMPDHLETLAGALMPVFKSLGIENPANSPQFLEYYRQCEARLYPPSPPLPTAAYGISGLLGLNYPAEPVGKIA